MRFLLPLLLALAVAADQVRVEFRNALQVDVVRKQILCDAVAQVMNGTADCASVRRMDQDAIRVSVIQLEVDDFLYPALKPGNVARLNALLREGGYFTLNQSSVTLFSRVAYMRTSMLLYCSSVTIVLVVTAILVRKLALSLPQHPPPVGGLRRSTWGLTRV